MRIIAHKTLERFWAAGHGDARGPLEAWYAEVRRARWQGMADIKRAYAHASVIDAERVVFNIAGNKYRLAVKVWFPGQQVYIKFVGTHADYDDIDISSL